MAFFIRILLAFLHLLRNQLNIMIRKFSILVLVILLFSCSGDDEGLRANFNDFEAISAAYPFSDIQADDPITYFEYIQSMPDYEDPGDPTSLVYRNNVHYSFGEICADADCRTAFYNLQADAGFITGCLPSYCFYYIKYQTQEESHVATSKEDVLDFLGEIDTPGEALLVARANDYYWSVNNKNNGAIKEIQDGFELIVMETVSYCLPFQTNRFHLKVDRQGNITIVSEEIAEIGENSCV